MVRYANSLGTSVQDRKILVRFGTSGMYEYPSHLPSWILNNECKLGVGVALDGSLYSSWEKLRLVDVLAA
jgi:hypothetical protein